MWFKQAVCIPKLGVSGLRKSVFTKSLTTSPIIQNAVEGVQEVGKAKKPKIVKKEMITKNILYCNFGKNNIHLALASVMEDENFLKNNPDLTYNQKVLYYLRLPQRVQIHLSAGNLGFKKAARGEYEAAFQTTAKMFQLIEEKKLSQNLEIDFRNFGKGREAFRAALLGKEGTKIRKLVTKVSDSTKLKFGGVRSPAERRL